MKIPSSIVKKLLTEKEEKVLIKRYKIAQLLQTNLTYREIAKQMGISTTTVVRLNQRLKIRKTKNTGNQSLSAKAKQKQTKKLPWVIG
jgi:Trp operon repressor